MADPTIEYFGQLPTTIILKTTTEFTGTAMISVPVITQGLYTFQEQVGGGHYNFHKESIDVKNITYGGAGSLAVKKVTGGKEVLIATLTPTAGELFENTVLSPGESLKFISTGSGAGIGTPAIVAITASLAGNWGI